MEKKGQRAAKGKTIAWGGGKKKASPPHGRGATSDVDLRKWLRRAALPEGPNLRKADEKEPVVGADLGGRGERRRREVRINSYATRCCSDGRKTRQLPIKVKGAQR